MEPMYPVGSLIYVEETQPSEIKEKDVITFYMKDTQIVATHQVYGIVLQNPYNKNSPYRTGTIKNISNYLLQVYLLLLKKKS